MKKVLVTCPPMLRQLTRFSEMFLKFNFDVTAPDVVQTLSEEELIELVPAHDGWIIGDDPATARVFEAGKAGRLKAAMKWGVGVDNVDFKACEDLGISIANTPGMFGAEVADIAICYLIGTARNVFYIDREIRAGGWPKPAGISLSGRTVGVVGLGDIGSNVAKRAAALGLNIVGWDPAAGLVPEYVRHKTWPEGIGECDFIVFACALNKVTKHIFNMQLLSLLKPGVRIVNVSRGGLIDEKALLIGLEEGKVASAALDVFESEPLALSHPLREHKQLIFGSHNSSNTSDAVIRTSEKALQMMKDFLNG